MLSKLRTNGAAFDWVRIDVLETDQPRYLCFVTLLLVCAMRMGAIEAKSLQEVMERCRIAPDRTLRWAQPAWPVLMRFSQTGLDIPQAATVNQLGDTVGLAAELAGLPVIVRTHDIRRGSMRDLSYLPPSSARGLATDFVANAAGHSNRTMTAGITQSYIGPQKAGNWDKRVAAIDKSEQDTIGEAFDLDITAAPYKRARLTMDEVTTFAVESGLDHETPKARRTVVTKLQRKKKSDWIDTAGESRPSIAPTKAAHPSSPASDESDPGDPTYLNSDGSASYEDLGAEELLFGGSVEDLSNESLDELMQENGTPSQSLPPSTH